MSRIKRTTVTVSVGRSVVELDHDEIVTAIGEYVLNNVKRESERWSPNPCMVPMDSVRDLDFDEIETFVDEDGQLSASMVVAFDGDDP